MSGLDPVQPRDAWWRRVLGNPWTWAVVVMIVLSILTLGDTYSLLSRDTTVEVEGRQLVSPGITDLSFKKAIHYAWPTAAVWSALFILLDRYRTKHFPIWFIAFSWGGSVACWASMYANTWMASMLSVKGGVDPSAGAGPAIFSAPFVEEFFKATILFILAAVIGPTLTSAVQTVSLAGLSAIGFAFVENIVYYARADNYASVTIDAGDPEAALRQMVVLRGALTSFGHPLFTSMTALGLAFGLRARSRIVRVMAPLTGFVMAVMGHMAFNGLSSTRNLDELRPYWWVSVTIVMIFILGLVLRLVAEGRMIARRLDDYAVMGWLPARVGEVVSVLHRRWWISAVALSHGIRCWWQTLKYLRRTTELAYLRDAEVRGLAANSTARQARLLAEIRGLSAMAVTESRGARLVKPHLPRWLVEYFPPSSGTSIPVMGRESAR